jgi:VCBS repeat-containing protein
MEFRKIFIGLGILAVVLSYGALAQQWPFCQSGCTAKDVQVDRVYLVNMRFVGGVYYVDVYADFSVTAANRYCIMVAAGFSSSGDCSNLVTAWRMFGDLSQGTYTNQYVATITVATRDLWVCRLYAIWRNQPYPGCPTGDCNLYGVGSKCWESTATPYLIRGLDAVDDYYRTAINTPLYVPPPGVLGNDYYPDGVAELVVVSGPDYGTVTLNPDGSFTYTPPSGWSGTASFVYQLKDTKGFTDTATVYITVSPNQPVDAVDDSYSTSEDTPLYVAAPGILGNDSYPDGFGSLAVVTPPTHGSLTLNQDGSFTYTPDPNFCGQDSYIYRLCDTDGDCDEATVTIHVTCVNDAPVAQDDTYTTNEDTPLLVPAPGVLRNDYDVDGDPLTAVLVSGPAHGTLALNPDGSFTYTPAENFCGEDSFTYKAYDGALYSNVATVRITVTCVNDAPVANDDEASVPEDSSVTVPVLGNDYDPDGDPLSVSLVSGPTHGWATVNPDGTITYTPNPDFCGTDSFTYKACDPAGACDTATVTIHVTCVNDAPVAQDDSYTTAEDTPLVVSAPGVLGNDSDVDGDPLTAVLVSGPAHGTLTLNPDGSFTYTPAENFCGEDSFTYKAYDGALYSNVATVRITVTCVNDAPVANDDEASVPEDSSVTIPVLGNDYDVDGDPLSVSLVSGPVNGRATVNPDGTITYTSNPDFCGTDSFTYKACDPAGACDTATVTIHVTCVNDAPVAQDDSYTTNEDTPLVVPAPGVLGNDYDVDGDPLTSVLVSGPAHGTLTLNSDGSFTYTPAENFCGEDSFTYKAYDGALYSNVATVRITVTCVNDAPVAQDDTYTTNEDTPLVVPAPGVLGNDYDVDGDPLTAVLVSGPAHGTLALNPDGSFTYTPAENFCGEDSFTYKAYDGALYSNVATVRITITCVNDAPVANDDEASVLEDSSVTIPVLGNDYDVDGDPLSVSLVSGPANGRATVNPDGTITYTPNPDFCGTDSFTYKACDPAGACDTATVTIHVTCVNDAPVAQDDSYTTAEDTPLVVSAPGVLGNDSDVDGDPLTAVLVSGPAHGTLTLNPDGSFTYTPAENFCGEDSFTYKAYDGALYSNVATVRITVTCVNDAPVANDDEASVPEDSSVTIPVLGNDYDVDGDPLSVSLVSGPANGRATVNPDGTITYTPNPDFCGTDSFTYKACDPAGACDTATVTIHVTCVNDAPVANDDEATVPEDSSVTIPVLGNDYDVDGDPLSVSIVSGPANGRATVNPDGTITYTPNPDFCGTDSFTYKACDPAGACDTATVTIHVTCVNDAPVAQDDRYTTNEDTPLLVPAPGILGNDYDVDGDPLTAVLVSGPAHGTLTLNPDGSFTYTPAENFCGEDSFTYKAYDGALYSNVATVRITITCVNDAPVANDDEASVLEDSSVTIPVLGNDYDPDGDPLSVSIVSGPTNGRATVNPDGTITYTPNPDFCGTDSFTYKACDPAGACDTATVTIHVTCVNDAPVAQDDTYTTNEDTPLVVSAPGVLGNDYDVDGDPLTAVLVSGPAHGTLTLNPDGSFTYTPAENLCGEDSFTYKAYDGALYSNVATVRITITCVNDAPVANDDEASVLEDSSVTIPVLGNDYDPDGDPLSVSIVSGPTNGRATVNPDGTITYTPNPDFCGTDSFTYKACDPAGACDTATVTIHVTCVNDAPVAQDDTYTTNEDTPLVVPAPGVLGNDYDVDGDPLTAVLVSGPAHGTLTLNSDGSFTYTPAENFCGEDSFTYKAYDGELYSNVATVRITVTCVNDAPVASDDEASVLEDSSVTIPVLGNDYDPDGDPLSVSLVSGPTHGRATVNPDGTITYTPNPDFCGTDSFTYKACDPAGACDTATVTIHVTCVNDAPVAQDDTYTTNEDTPLVVPAPGVLGNDYDVDGDPLTSVLVSGPAHGTLTLNSDGSFTYTPAENFCGEDSFTYKAYDGALYSNVATVRITVTCVNDAPVANDDEASVPEDSSVTVPVLGNDYDPDGDPLSVSIVSGPTHGRATVNPDGTITYTPNPDFCGTDSFTYKACDPAGACDTATVTIHVTCVNDAPVAQDDSYTTNEDTPLVVPAPGVLGNDYDVDGDPLTSVLVSGPAHGTLTLNPDGSFTYTPNSKFYGTDTFTYRVFDGELYSNVATVTITVSFVNDPMEANDLSLRTCVNEGKAFEVQISDLDILWAGFTGYPVTFELISGPEHGTIAGDWNTVRYEEGAALLTLLYTPDANFIGSDELRIRAFDPYGQFVVFAVRITVESCGLTPAGAAGLVPGPVVIHEIAWAGTSASAEDQWIELLNLSDSSVNLEGWILRWRKKNPKTPEDLIWREIRLQGTIEPYGFFLLERGHDDVVKNVRADLIYPTVFRAGDKDLPLLFSVEGDVVELLNEKGELVDTANADPQRLEGWAAGNTLPASMERKSPFLPDLDENWHTNLGIVSFGKDRKGNDLTATARNPNEPEILAIAGETLVVERGQKVALSRFVPNAPEAKVVVLRADVAGGAGALVPFDNEAFELRYDELVKTAVALLDTKALEPGAYKVVVTLGAGQYAVFSLVVR